MKRKLLVRISPPPLAWTCQKKNKNSENVFTMIIIRKCEKKIKKNDCNSLSCRGSSLPNKPHILNSTVHPPLQLLLGGGCRVYLAEVRVGLKDLSMVRLLPTSFF
jgi:hypothetical protein